jgi:hypothetical protein
MYSTRVARVLAVAVVAAAPLACGAEPASPPPASTLDIAAACAEYVAAYETAALCTSVDIVAPWQWQAEVPAGQARTRELFEERCRTWLGAPGSRVTPAVLHTCTLRIRGNCVPYFGDFLGAMFAWQPSWTYSTALCDFDIPGTLPDGVPCGDSTQCAGGRCDRHYGAACGACVSRPAVGERCVPLPDGCAKGAICPYCKGCGTPQICEAVPRPGDEGEDCTGRRCAMGLVCDAATTHTCTLPGLPGAACTDHDYCRFKWCALGVCANQSEEGGTCASDLTCRPGLVCQGFRCVPVSPPPPAVPLGAECRPSRDECLRGSWCPNGTCVAQARLGETCKTNAECADTPFVECLDGKCQLFDPGACR